RRPGSRSGARPPRRRAAASSPRARCRCAGATGSAAPRAHGSPARRGTRGRRAGSPRPRRSADGSARRTRADPHRRAVAGPGRRRARRGRAAGTGRRGRAASSAQDRDVPAPPRAISRAARSYAGAMTVDVLLTGFAPFDGAEINESWEAVARAVPLLRGRGFAVASLELPVEFGRAGELLAAAVREHRPSLVLCLGLAAGRTGITPERVAVNVRDARIPDAVGASPIDEPVVEAGPVGYFSTLPVKAMVAALAE